MKVKFIDCLSQGPVYGHFPYPQASMTEQITEAIAFEDEHIWETPEVMCDIQAGAAQALTIRTVESIMPRGMNHQSLSFSCEWQFGIEDTPAADMPMCIPQSWNKELFVVL